MVEDNTPQSSDIIFYSSPAGDVKIEVIFNDEPFGSRTKILKGTLIKRLKS